MNALARGELPSEACPVAPTSRSNTQHRLRLRMLDAVAVTPERDASVVRPMLSSPRQGDRAASIDSPKFHVERRWLFAPEPIGPPAPPRPRLDLTAGYRASTARLMKSIGRTMVVGY